MEFETKLNNEMYKVTALLSFLITQPQMGTTLTGIQKDQLQTLNLIRVKCVKIWADAMVDEIKSKCIPKTVEQINKLFKEHITVKIKEWSIHIRKKIPNKNLVIEERDYITYRGKAKQCLKLFNMMTKKLEDE